MEKILDLSKLSTEEINSNTKELSFLSTSEMVKKMNEEDKKVALAVETQLDQIAKAIDLLDNVIKNGGRIFYVGAGTSGGLAALDASEMPVTYNVDSRLFIAIVAGGVEGMLNPIKGDEDSITEAVEVMNSFNFSKADGLVAISASGRTPFTLAAIEYAKEIGNKNVVTVATSRNSLMSKLANVAIEAVTGAETITGSTRMKSGTAQKLILNMISTGLMVKQGKVHGNLMIDVVPANEKLRERALNIIMSVANTTKENALELLEASKDNVRSAIEKAQAEIGVEGTKALEKIDELRKQANSLVWNAKEEVVAEVKKQAKGLKDLFGIAKKAIGETFKAQAKGYIDPVKEIAKGSSEAFKTSSEILNEATKKASKSIDEKSNKKGK